MSREYLAMGGPFRARGTDTVPTMLTPGELVLNANQSFYTQWAKACEAAGCPGRSRTTCDGWPSGISTGPACRKRSP